MKRHRSTNEATVPPVAVSDSDSSNGENAIIIDLKVTTTPKTRSTNSKQTKLSPFFKRPVSIVRQNKINDLIFKMVVKDIQPFSIVEHTGVQDLLGYLEPGSKIPSRYKLGNT